MNQHREIAIWLDNYKINVRGKAWGSSSSMPIIALHGWLDNSASFNSLAEHFSPHNFIALDLPGHGLSDHLPFTSSYNILSFVEIVSAAINSLDIKKFHLLGHSLGACVATILAASQKQKIKSLNLIEGIGPMSLSARELPEKFSNFLDKTLNFRNITPLYQSVNDAAKARQKKTSLNLKAAIELAERGTYSTPKGIKWTTDKRLMIPSSFSLSEEQVLAFIKEIDCPTLVIIAKDGFLDQNTLIDKRIKTLNDLKIIKIIGSHYLHLDCPHIIAKSTLEQIKKTRSK